MRPTILMVIVLGATAAFAQDYPYADYFPDEAALAKATAACGPDDIKFDVTLAASPQPVPAVESGKALVFMIQEDGGCGDCYALTKAGLDGAWIGANQGRSYFAFAVTPGQHHLCVRWQSVFSRGRLAAVASFKAEQGTTYYFRSRVFGEGLDLDPINSDQGALLVAAYPLSVSHVRKKRGPVPGAGSGPQPAH
jgi:hypothetical protein